MADILTQLQTCLDQLATQFYATLCYLSTYHDNAPATPPPDVPDAMPPLAKIPKNQPSAAPMPAGAVQAQQAQAQAQGQAQGSPAVTGQQQQQQQPEGQAPTTGPAAAAADQPPRPDSPRTFAYRQRELARDLIIKEQQIEYLIGRLPGIGSSEAEQEARIRELEGELRQVEAERERKARELRLLGRKLEVVLGAVERGVYARDKN
ncbi:hypothetical protein VTN77DRAFT_5601 [Rasamsonia byssochlamydoides]|uniref:uncharacterized protein n=1 Tax=Rasamsonia byssochlamydoides TaxID=89139 RepID=UPI0037424B7B